MVALILAAGYGTRLYPLAAQRPKALLPIKGRPILRYLVDKLEPSDVGIRRGILVSNHRFAEQFQDWFSSAGLKVPWTVLDDSSTSEENRLGSMGDLAFALKTVSLDDDLLVLGSDNLFPDELGGFLSFARSKAPAVTLGSYALADPSLACRYGVLTVEASGRVLQFEEKPTRPTSSSISTAVYFFPRKAVGWVLEYVGSVAAADSLGVFIRWLIARESVFAYPFQGPWFDVGDIDSYTQAEESFNP